MQYKVIEHYSSSTMTLKRGSTVDLDDAMAAWLLRDCPGVIEPVKAKPAKKPAAKPKATAPRTRQVRGPEKDR